MRYRFISEEEGSDVKTMSYNAKYRKPVPFAV